MKKHWLKETLSRLFPRSSKYDSQWALQNSLGENVLFNTESLCSRLGLKPGMRVLDLGCGKAASSIFIAKEYGCQVWAVDSETSVWDNLRRVRKANLESQVFPVRADARKLPFDKDFFDVVIAVDSYFYYGADPDYLPYISKFLRKGGKLGIIDACLKTVRRARLPSYVGKFSELILLRPIDAWRRLWNSARGMRVVQAEIVPEGDLLLENYAHDYADASSERNVVRILRKDAGRLIGLFRMIAVRESVV